MNAKELKELKQYLVKHQLTSCGDVMNEVLLRDGTIEDADKIYNDIKKGRL